jgi:hypothetical protein
MMCGAAVNQKVFDPARPTILRVPAAATRAVRGK